MSHRWHEVCVLNSTASHNSSIVLENSCNKILISGYFVWNVHMSTKREQNLFLNVCNEIVQNLTNNDRNTISVIQVSVYLDQDFK